MAPLAPMATPMLCSAFVFLRWFQLSHVYIQVSSLHNGSKESISKIFIGNPFHAKIRRAQSLIPGLRSRRKNNTAPAPELFFSWTWLQLRSSLFAHGSNSRFCSISHISIFNCFGVSRVEWKMNYIKYTKRKEYNKLFEWFNPVIFYNQRS